MAGRERGRERGIEGTGLERSATIRGQALLERERESRGEREKCRKLKYS